MTALTANKRDATGLTAKIKRLQEDLLQSVNAFRTGSDPAALDFFRNSLEDLEDILDCYVCLGEPAGMDREALPALRALDNYISNQDCTGIADTLEYAIYPLVIKWMERQTE